MAMSTLRSTFHASAALIRSSSAALLGTDRLVVGVGVRPFGHHGVVLVEQRLDLGDAVHHVALDVLRRVELRLLAQVADRETGRQPRLADEAVIQPGHDAKQARLPCPVRPDDADLGARVERDRDVLEDRSVRRVVAGELVGRVDELCRHGTAQPGSFGKPWRCASWKASLASVSAVCGLAHRGVGQGLFLRGRGAQDLGRLGSLARGMLGALGCFEAEPGCLRGLVGRLRGTLCGLGGEARHAGRFDRRGMVAFGCPPVRQQFRRRALAQALSLRIRPSVGPFRAARVDEAAMATAR